MAESNKYAILRPLFTDQSHYAKAFKYCMSVADNLEAIQKWTNESFCEHVVEKLVADIGEGTDDKLLRVLGVGSGSGEIELLFLDKLLIKFPHIHSCVVEPCADLLEKYQAKVEENAMGITYDWQMYKLEDFVANQQENSQKYHFISAISSMYYVKDLNQALRSLHDMLAPGGILLVTIAADYTGYGKLWRTFPSLGSEISSQDESPESAAASSHHRDSAHVRDALRQLQIPYHIDEYAFQTKITQCFDAKQSEEGDLMLDFLTHAIRFREASKDLLYQQVLACIKESCVQNGGDWFFQSKMVCFFITKI
ncbi:histamine N-methyltransferase-like isoform X1 [Amphiura filiformis]|uniref:histamine N-methyltransferase-like isoform X1 n=1 Tax=Amphiura filiformis TaxID=82378 RepID=UPI003B21A4ED